MSEPLSDELIAEMGIRLREFEGWYGPNGEVAVARLLATISARDAEIARCNQWIEETKNAPYEANLQVSARDERIRQLEAALRKAHGRMLRVSTIGSRHAESETDWDRYIAGTKELDAEIAALLGSPQEATEDGS